VDAGNENVHAEPKGYVGNDKLNVNVPTWENLFKTLQLITEEYMHLAYNKRIMTLMIVYVALPCEER